MRALAAWRVGWSDAPLAFVPRAYCSWQHRFDDPRREYRTIYAARAVATCLLEVLQDFRPDTRMLAEYAELFGGAPVEPGAVPASYLAQTCLVPARLQGEGELANVDRLELRAAFERSASRLLVAQGMAHFDISQVRSRDRVISRAFSRFAHEAGAAGVRFRSNLDDRRCYALFEGRAELVARGTAEPLTAHPALPPVAAQLNLTLPG